MPSPPSTYILIPRTYKCVNVTEQWGIKVADGFKVLIRSRRLILGLNGSAVLTRVLNKLKEVGGSESET
jgi:hypothetical protein